MDNSVGVLRDLEPERCDVMQVLLKKVLLLGSRTKTIVGRPFVANASVTATVEAQVSPDMEPSMGPAALLRFFAMHRHDGLARPPCLWVQA